MSRKASPLLKVGLVLVVVLVGAARLTAKDIPACSREITRCLAACRAICSRRLADDERTAKCPRQHAAPVSLSA